MSIPPTQVPTYPDVPQTAGVPPVLRQIGQVQSTVAMLTADVAQVLQLFQAPAWGIFTSSGAPVLASSSSVDQLVNQLTSSPIAGILGLGGNTNFVCSIGTFEYQQDYRVAFAPQEQGAFTSYNKVQLPFSGRITILSGGTAPQRSAFLGTADALLASLDLFAVVTPEMTYASVNITHVDYGRTARRGVSLLALMIGFEQIRVTGTTQYSSSSTGSPGGADPVNTGAVTPLAPAQDPNVSGSLTVSPAGGLT